ncbi:MAG: NAD(P)H-dependent oxidoreductase subunit E [Candidatus Omnitrophica bacterium]|nr:NAD(P)H-dependent oxidoreductase subunit E [Candidatus Omnitrophota bacterium]
MEKQTQMMTEAQKKENKKNFRELQAFIDDTVKPEDPQRALMGVLHKVQNLFGYISQEAMDYVSERLSVPTAHIYGMATFYNYFSLKPKAHHKIHVCKGTACYVGGGARVLNRLKKELEIGEGDVTSDGLFSLDITRCLGCCGLSPVMQVNDDVYVRMVPEKVPVILKKYRSCCGHGIGHNGRRKKTKAGKKAVAA